MARNVSEASTGSTQIAARIATNSQRSVATKTVLDAVGDQLVTLGGHSAKLDGEVAKFRV